MATIEGKVVIIMGASSGIGEATTKKLALEGAKLVLAARREDRLKALVESLPNADISYAVADVSPDLVDTELYTTVYDPENRELLKKNAKIEGLGLKSSEIADAVAYAISTPETVAVSEILIRPTKQLR